MENLKQFWAGLSAAARTGLAFGVLLVLLAVGALGLWAMHTDYKVLFSGMEPKDAATMVAELERGKIPYRLEADGGTILVPEDVVYKTRLQLVGKDLPLHGAVGLELFNNADIGMTEFAQKVNYQRAQQGELTRTILSIEEIQSARVHLALPEQGLFKRAGAEAKASVTLAMKPGKALRPAQVAGIQRLVAAAVPGIKAEDVTILDQHGVALTRVAAAEGEEGEASGQGLESKRALEQYLNGKLVAVLDQTFGAGQAIASVDVTLNQDRSKTTTESVLPNAPANQEQNAAGVMVREKVSSQGSADGVRGGAAGKGEVVNSETEFQVGRRVEQVVAARGTISRLNVAVVVRQPLDEGQLAQLREVAALAVGLNSARGDAIAVHSLSALARPELPQPAAAPAAPAAAAPQPLPASPSGAPGPASVVAPLLATLAALAVLALAWAWRRQAAQVPRLSQVERERLLGQLHGWMAGSVRESGK